MDAIEALRRALRGRAEVRLALLFGSRARGRGDEGADIDLAVEARGVDLLELASELSLAAGCEVDVVDLEQAGYPLLKAVLRDGVPVHEGAPGALAIWRSHTIAQLETDRPWFERMRDAYLRRRAEAGGHG
jgi:predicted nucleotidyltransferase